MKKSFFAAILLLLLIAVLASCVSNNPDSGQSGEPTGNTADATDPTADVTGDAPEVTEEIDLAAYTLIRPDRAPTALVKLGANFKRALDDATGSDVVLSDDYLGRGETLDPDAKEILIGKTNRPESEAVYAELGDAFAFCVRKIGSKLVVAAPTPELIGEALDYLMEIYVLPTGGDGKFTIRENLSYQSVEIPYLEIIDAQGVPQYQVVRGQNASSKVIAAAVDLFNLISADAPDQGTLTTDWIRPGRKYDLSVKSIIVGDTEYDYCRTLRAGKSYFEWQLEQTGNQIYLFGLDDYSVGQACERLKEMIARGTYSDGSKTVRIRSFEPEKGIYSDWCGNIPIYAGGTLDSIREFTNGCFRIYVTDTAQSEFDAYLSALAGKGFERYAENTINGNAYVTFRNEKAMVHAYYLPTVRTAHILVSSASGAVEYPTVLSDTAGTVRRTVTLMDMDYEKQTNHDNGAGFVFRLSDGSYVIIDGGQEYEAEKLYQYLADNNEREDGKILIRAWIITHPDGDHYENFVAFTDSHAKDVGMEYFIAQFDKSFQENFPVVNKRIADCVLRYGARYIVPLAGQKMALGELEVEFLYTGEMLWPDSSSDPNDYSLAFRVTFGGKTFLMTGDILERPIKIMNRLYGTAMQSDFLSLPHHGLNKGSDYNTLFANVDPSYVFFNTARGKAAERIRNSSSLTYLLNSLHVEKYYVADGGYTVINLSDPDDTEQTYALADYSDRQDHISWEAFRE
ncbi:MAG: hypothetical protein IJU94_03780 [Clostridia bacterium]|nr:hypothetical protein [Clostridia bacterium]